MIGLSLGLQVHNFNSHFGIMLTFNIVNRERQIRSSVGLEIFSDGAFTRESKASSGFAHQCFVLENAALGHPCATF